MALRIQVLVVGELSTNCYFLIDTASGSVLVVDPGDAPEYISDVLLKEKLNPVGVLATHGHFDHILGAFGLQVMYNIPFFIHPEDEFLVARMQESGRHFLKRKNVDPAPRITNRLHDGEKIRIGESGITVLHTPGHTPGSVAVYGQDANAVLVGDGLFADGSRGRTDTSYGDNVLLTQSIRRIVSIDDGLLLYPGHGGPIPVGRARMLFGV